MARKLIALFVFVLGLSFSLSAQEKIDESRWVVDRLESFSFQKEFPKAKAPPAPGVQPIPSLKVNYSMGGGCEDHKTTFEVTGLSLRLSSAESQTVEAKIQIVDSTVSGRWDPCKAIISIDGSVSGPELIAAVREYNKRNRVIDVLRNEGPMQV